MHTVLVISSGIFHPPLLGRLRLWQALRATPGVTLRHAGSVEVLARADLACHAVVLYFHGRTISPTALEALDRFARGGGGILAVHAATASFKATPAFTDILGGRFTGHPPVGPIEIRATAPADEIFGTVPAFKVTDEAYRHDLAADIRVHFTARPAPRPGGLGASAAARAAEDLPIVWTRRHAAGRICYAGPGHCAGSLRHPGMVRILQAGLAWVCRAGEEGPQ